MKLVLCSDLGDLSNFCSENFPKTDNDFVYFSVNVTLIELRIKIKRRIDVKYNCK